ncbi:hypothetical protein HG535_0E04390 [Zygotorulaspora mrakii]|uniref:Uncharacterized protein n=1 Tax=Zygotorulaspora mrakii TaxID=42260 RepID=A0A7H9B3X5_ZYGMR|nr:uncharacterized protein HG535_0E04390 [Zygotorulaspora mrakii]QLG73355.1 hypothetical protein HG535_0E04390 [Zygotorulaspora mrakii]
MFKMIHKGLSEEKRQYCHSTDDRGWWSEIRVTMDAVEDKEVWRVTYHDRKVFLKSAKLHHSIHDSMLQEQKKREGGGKRCMNTLHAIVESLQYDHVMVTNELAFHKSLWDTKIYEDDPSSFPVSHVPIKCNVISTVVDLLRNYSRVDPSLDSKGKVCISFRYLEKLLDATKSSTHTQINPSIDASIGSKHMDVSSSIDSTKTLKPTEINASIYPMPPAATTPPSKRWSAQSLFSSVKRSNSRSKPVQNTSTSKTTFNPTSTRMSISTSTSTAASIRSSVSNSTTDLLLKRVPNDTIVKRREVSEENMTKFQEYKPLIVALYHRLRVIDAGKTENEFIFQFVNDIICNFIVDDCKTILVHHIEHHIVQWQDQNGDAHSISF